MLRFQRSTIHYGWYYFPGSLTGSAGVSYHAYLLLSKETFDQTTTVSGSLPAATIGSTMVLETGQELKEVTEGYNWGVEVIPDPSSSSIISVIS
jgi:hypothetical protein